MGLKILNLYAGIGGNRTLWGENHEITAVEWDKGIAEIYKSRFPLDKVVVGDALEYLEDHWGEFDFVWASPPCPSHSRLRTMPQNKKLIPDMKSLYGLITFLKFWFKGKWIVENVMPYYPFLIPPTVILGRHPFWANFIIPEKGYTRKTPHKQSGLRELCEEYGVPYEEIQEWHGVDKRKVLRNCVDYRLGKYILDCAIGRVKTLEAFV